MSAIDTWSEYKSFVANDANQVFKDKYEAPHHIPTLFDGRDYINDQGKLSGRLKKSVISRTMLILDFDNGAIIQNIQSILAQYVYIMWTTHSHLTSKIGEDSLSIPKYRVVLPLKQPISPNDWEVDYIHRLLTWSTSNFVAMNKVDPSCFNLQQLAIGACINPTLGYCEIWINDGPDTTWFDVTVLPSVPKKPLPQQPVLVNYPQTQWTPSTCQIANIIRILKKQGDLQHIPAKPFSDNKINRAFIAYGMCSIGATYQDWSALDQYLAKPNTKTNSRQLWDSAIAYHDKHPGLILKLLGKMGRTLCGFDSVKHPPITEGKWDKELTCQYLDYEILKGHRRILLCADMGIGKNHLWINYNGDKRIILLTPLTTIVRQSGSTNKLREYDQVVTYDQACTIPSLIQSGNIKPSECILVIDEAHNFGLTAYRQTALTKCEAILGEDWSQIIWQSATLDTDTLDGFTPIDYKIRVHKENPPKLRYLPYQQRTEARNVNQINNIIESIFKRHLTKAIVLWNNKKCLIELKNILKKQHNMNVEMITRESVQQLGTAAYNLAESSNYTMNADNLDVLLGTASIVEGVSIQDQLNAAIVIVVGREPWQFIQQVCGRFRKAKKIYCYHIADFDMEKNSSAYIKCNPSNQLWNGKNREQWVKNELDLIDKNNATATRVHNKSGLATFQLATGGTTLGVVEDQYTGQLLHTNTPQLLVTAKYINFEMYSNGSEYAAQVMQQRGFVVSRICFHIKELDKKICAQRNTNRRKRTADKASMLKKVFVDPLLKFLQGNCTNNLVSHDLVRQYLDPFHSLPNKNSPFTEMMDLLRAQIDIDGRIHIINAKLYDWAADRVTLKTVKKLANAINDDGAITALRKKYPSGTRLSLGDQQAVLGEFIETLMQDVQSAHGWTRDKCFSHVMQYERFSRTKGIAFNNNQVEITHSRPMQVIKEILQLESRVIRVGGKQERIGIVK